MAAQIKPKSEGGGGNVRKPQLIGKIEADDVINMAVIIPKEDGVISVSDDRTVRVWLKRDTGLFWPSICHNMPAEASTIAFDKPTHKLFIGLDNGAISEFKLAEDYNAMTHIRDYIAHQSRVTGVYFSVQCEWVLSTGRDKYFQWHCSESARRLGGYQTSAWCTCIEFDEQSKYVFVGDYGGCITILKIGDNNFEVITLLRGHTGSVRALAWDADRSLLFSGSFDQSIIVWDIGGQKGTAFELQGHNDKIQSMLYAPSSKQLISGGDDHTLVVWNMDSKRSETPSWKDNDTCQKCGTPFFWNFKSMWEQKTIGLRQHHCRKCGKAVCHKCSSARSSIPAMGYEFDVRVCDECFNTITDEDKAPMATFHDTKHSIMFMHLDETRKLLLTIGKDRVMKLWDMVSVLQ
ncbi:unnamed protein product [Owenia fusiformis]|uniref:Uncharacterized protein n=1 Tax=Owenia fusiformis TaxID=6347 RepID=A0A8J1UB61_OWEFU|nr:unnamed protein product [Owenia fusiformis]